MAENKALIIVDMFNRFDFPGAQDLAPNAAAIAAPIAGLSKRFLAEGDRVIYCNDEVDGARDAHDFAQAMLSLGGPSAVVARQLYIGSETPVVAKPGHSGFFDTSLESLLRHAGIERITIAGVAADLCVLATAIDGSMRGFDVTVHRDLIAAETPAKRTHALAILEQSFKLKVSA
jgi:nicotinamidase-related amidase